MWISQFLQILVRILVGAYPRWVGCKPSATQRIYIANHTSHIDTLAIWTALPPDLQRTTHPVAAWDYWANNRIKKYITTQGLNAVYIKRSRADLDADATGASGGVEDPLKPLYDTLASGESLIIFPEGTRHKEALPQPFKSGIYHLAKRFPHVEIVPVYLENLSRIMPKGEFWPVPLACTARFGTPLYWSEDESKEDFLSRARQGVIDARAPMSTSN